MCIRRTGGKLYLGTGEANGKYMFEQGKICVSGINSKV